MRADSGFYTHSIVALCRKTKVRFSITIRQRASLRNLIEAIPEDAWTPIPSLDGGRRRSWPTTAYTPIGRQAQMLAPRVGSSSGEASARRPRRPRSPPTAITASAPTGTGTPWIWRPTIAATPRSKTPSVASTAWGLNHLPTGRSPPTPPGWRCRCWPTTGPLDGAHRSR